MTTSILTPQPSPLRHQNTVMIVPDRIATDDDWRRLPAMVRELGVMGVYFDCSTWSRGTQDDRYVHPDTLTAVVAELRAMGRAVGPHIVLPAGITDWRAQYDELRRLLAVAVGVFGQQPGMIYCDGAERYGFGPRAYVSECLSVLGDGADLIECSDERNCLDLITSLPNVDVPPAAEVWLMSAGIYHARMLQYIAERVADVEALRATSLLRGSGKAMCLGWMGPVQRQLDEPARLLWPVGWVQTFSEAKRLGSPVRARMTLESLVRMDRAAFRAAMEGRE